VFDVLVHVLNRFKYFCFWFWHLNGAWWLRFNKAAHVWWLVRWGFDVYDLGLVLLEIILNMDFTCRLPCQEVFRSICDEVTFSVGNLILRSHGHCLESRWCSLVV
jgi:hypothetical protein